MKKKIIIVKHEIESWYLAGLNKEILRKLKINFKKYITDDITKDKFDHLMPKKFNSRIDFMIEILRYFSIETAMKRNNSFRYFCNKYLS